MSVTRARPCSAARPADVELRLPADSAYVSVLRTTTAGLAARLDFTIDDIEDLRIAVGEASAMVLPEADAGGDLLCRFYLRPGELTVAVAVDLDGPGADARLRQLRLAGAHHPGHERGRPTAGDGVFSVSLTMVSGHLGAGL